MYLIKFKNEVIFFNENTEETFKTISNVFCFLLLLGLVLSQLFTEQDLTIFDSREHLTMVTKSETSCPQVVYHFPFLLILLFLYYFFIISLLLLFMVYLLLAIIQQYSGTCNTSNLV